jgi:predicted transcriptional regulator
MNSSSAMLEIPEKLWARLAQHAEAEGKSAKAYVLEALKEKVDRTERRRAYLSAGAAALARYERGGIAYAMEDVERYILGIAAGGKPGRSIPARISRKKT